MGYKLLGKISKNNVSQDFEDIDIGQEAVAVFNNNEEVEDEGKKDDIDNREESDNSNINDQIKVNNFFMKAFLNSNAYMRVAYEKDQGNASSVSLVPSLPGILKKSLSPQTYFRSQLPAILNLVNASAYTSASFSSSS